MTQEQKDLLLKDLCARLPYKVKFGYKYIDGLFREKYGISTLTGVRLPYHIEHHTRCGNEYLKIEKDEIKPYLFPLSSMTEDQKENALPLLNNCDYYIIDGTIKWLDNCPITFFDWCNKHHFDYRGLIPMGLAIDATNLNIY